MGNVLYSEDRRKMLLAAARALDEEFGHEVGVLLVVAPRTRDLEDPDYAGIIDLIAIHEKDSKLASLMEAVDKWAQEDARKAGREVSWKKERHEQ